MAHDSGRHRIESPMVQPSTKHRVLPEVVDHHVGVSATQSLAQAAGRSARGPRARLRKCCIIRQVVILKVAGRVSDIVQDLNLAPDAPRQRYSHVDPPGRRLNLVTGLAGAQGFLPPPLVARSSGPYSIPHDGHPPTSRPRRRPGSSAVARDVTEQRRVLEVAARMAAIVENSDDAIIGSTLERISTSWNPAAERMFGYSSEEIVGKSARLLTPPDRADGSVTILARIGAGQHVEHLETTGVRKDATLFPVSLSASPIRDPDGAIVGTSAIVRA